MMQEISRGNREGSYTGPSGPGDLFAPGVDQGGLATVCHGLYSERLPVVNMTVRAIRERFRDRLDIDPLSQAVIDGHGVDDDTIVQAGELLTFVRKAGEKGSRELVSPRV